MRWVTRVILAAAFGGCSLSFDFENPAEEMPADSIGGRVVQEEAGTGAMAPVHPCRIAARHTPISVGNEPDGRFRMPDIPAGEYELIFQCDADGVGNYSLKQRRPGIHLEPGDAVNLGDVVVQRTGSISGVVRRGDAPAGSGVLVVLEDHEDGGATGLSGYTDEAGAYRIGFVPPGAYTVVASAPGELGQQLPVEVREQQETEAADVALDEAAENGSIVGRTLIWGVSGTSSHGGITVTATSGAEVLSDQTASDGSYFFVDVPPGGVSLRAELEFHVPASVWNLVVRPGEERSAPEMYLLSEVLEDCDGDGIPDDEDPDDDNDGFGDPPSEPEAFRCDPSEWEDTDGDGQGDNADVDDDDDGLMDWRDACPKEHAMTADGCPGGAERERPGEEPEADADAAAEADADAETAHEADASADQSICTCSTTGLCCDGCHPTNEGGGCDDLDLCTEMDSCIAGSCVGTMRDCNDDEVCTADSCERASGCVNSPLLDGTPCNGGFPHATSNCTSGSCQLTACDTGWHDINADPADGCEYSCVPSGPDDTCNGLDENCDGTPDDGVDTTSDHFNCGSCGNDCTVQFANAVGHCVASNCELLACLPGYVDQDAVRVNGCEVFCTPSPEICDGADNDCDGSMDEDFDTMTDPLNCGFCGNDCTIQFANATGICLAGSCQLGSCNPGFHDLNASSADGCEYPCVPSDDGTDLCDGVDNDCDGAADEDWSAIVGNPCDVGIGACNNSGVLQCRGDGLGVECSVTPHAPTGEVCDGSVDENCDGLVDEGCVCAAGPRACGTSEGACTEGSQDCSGSWSAVCVGETAPVSEMCNTVDDDCDGMIDEADPSLGNACGTSEGECTEGRMMCVAGAMQCVGARGPRAEICDGLDNDCDTSTDEDVPEAGQPCGTDEGACVQGSYACIAGVLECQGQIGPIAETCDGADNDCDGLVDEDWSIGFACLAPGECGPGLLECDGAAAARCSTAPGGSDDQSVLEVPGNGQDDDCDGEVDE